MINSIVYPASFFRWLAGCVRRTSRRTSVLGSPSQRAALSSTPRVLQCTVPHAQLAKIRARTWAFYWFRSGLDLFTWSGEPYLLLRHDVFFRFAPHGGAPEAHHGAMSPRRTYSVARTVLTGRAGPDHPTAPRCELTRRADDEKNHIYFSSVGLAAHRKRCSRRRPPAHLARQDAERADGRVGAFARA